jgi:hypothetical protein
LTSADAHYRYHACYQPSVGPGEHWMDLELARCRLAEYAREHGHPPFECPPGPLPT